MEIRTNHFPSASRMTMRNHFDSENEFAPRLALADARAVHPRLVSTFEGRIVQMLLTFPEYVADEPLHSIFRDLLRKLRAGLIPEALLVVLAHQTISEEVRGWLTDAGFGDAQVVPVENTVNFTVWAEDAYVGVFDADASDKVFLVEPPAFGRAADGLLADYASAQRTDIATYQVPLYFQGGNVLVGDDFFLIGKDYPLKTLEDLFVSSTDDPQSEVAEAYRRYLDPDRRLFVVGTAQPVVVDDPAQFDPDDGQRGVEVFTSGAGRFQPIFHIDMLISLAGRDKEGIFRLMVGDPRLAASIMGVELPDHANSAAFDEVATDLVSKGFNVLRNPLPYTYYDEWDTDNDRWIRTWYYATANNSLVELDDEIQQVWLPTYGYGKWAALKAVDEANRKVWEGLGFVVHELGDFHPLAQWMGAVHCVKKYLRRQPR